MEPSFTQPGNCIIRFPSVRWMKTHCSIIFQPVLWGVSKELYWLLQKWSLKNDMLQQGELRVVGCEYEDPTWVHLDSKKGWVEWMHLCIEGAIKIAYRKIEMFHLPSHSIAFFALLDFSKFTKRPTTCSKKVGVFKLAVEVVDKQGDYPPFFVIKSGEEGVDASFDSRESLGLSNDLTLKGANHISSIIQ